MESLQDLIRQGAAHAWLFVLSAILLGALHGLAKLAPGHSKTMMAAFIVALRGTAVACRSDACRLVTDVLPDRAAEASTATWDLSSLTLAALYFHPEMEVPPAKLALAKAGVKTARQTSNRRSAFRPDNTLLSSTPRLGRSGSS